jgi:hypothetical protein
MLTGKGEIYEGYWRDGEREGWGRMVYGKN